MLHWSLTSAWTEAKQPARAVVVDDQIVNAQNALVAQQQFPQAAAFFRVGLAAQQPVHRVPADLVARLEDDQRHHHDRYSRRCASRTGRTAPVESSTAPVASTSLRLSLEAASRRAVVGGPAQTAVEEVQPRLRPAMETASTASTGQERLSAAGARMASTPSFKRVKAITRISSPYAQRAQILHPAVAEGMLRIHGLTGHAGGDQRHNAARRVGQVVGRVRQNGHRAAEKPDQKFAGRQKQVDQNAHAGAQRAIGGADFSVFRVFIILYKTADQPCRHFSFLHCAPKDADLFSL